MKKWFPGIILVCSLSAGCGGSKDPAPVTVNTSVKQTTTSITTTPAPASPVSVTVTQTPAVDENLKKGQDLAISRNYADALPLLVQAVKTTPDSPDANLWLFICRKHLETSRQPATLATAKRVVALMPNSQGAKQAQDYIDGISNTRTTPSASASAAPGGAATPEAAANVDESSSELVQALTLTQTQLAKLSGPSTAEIQQNHTAALELAKKDDFAACVKSLELNLPLLEKGLNPGGAAPSPDQMKRIGLVQIETQFCLGLASEKAKDLPGARKYLTLAAADNKGATEEWEGKSDWVTTQKFAKAELEKLK